MCWLSKLSVCISFLPQNLHAAGTVMGPAVPTESSVSEWSGPYAFVEWNVADLLFRRGRIHAEYAAVDGLAFGFSLEYQNSEASHWSQQYVLFGASTSQYFQSLGLKGLFARGEASLLAASFHEAELSATGPLIWHEGNTVAMMFGLDLGYRQPLGKHFVVSSALGGRRMVPDFFRMHQSQDGDRYEARQGLWQPKVDFSLGFSF